MVETFDAAKRRARVQPALQLVLDDGTTLDRPPLVNVPVLFPSGGGFVFTFPLGEGDPVLLLFSERGLTTFKETYETTIPTAGRFFSQSDAMALPGFGPLHLMPATDTGSAWQTDDGTRSIRLEPNRVEAHVGDTSLVIEEGRVTANVPEDGTIHLGGPGGEELATKSFVRDQYNEHTHNIAAAGFTERPTQPSPLTPGSDITKKGKSE